jgi:outer membrane protein OmpA-like peptidoglycan-associated protein/uncharacterized membrane protein (UPF0127 family)/Flp pilus assembly protein TadG
MPTMPYDRDADAAGSAVLLTTSGAHPLRLRRAASFISRFCGLMLRAPLAPDAGLLLTGCPSVHTAFMRCAIDVVYLDAQGVVLKCVPQLRPWWGSVSNAGRDAAGRRHRRAAHTLELAAGSVARLGIVTGSQLQHPRWLAAAAVDQQAGATRRRRQRGAAIVELAVVAPVLTVLGLSAAQYSSLFFAKNQVNHAAFLAARAGSVGNANLDAIKQAYIKGLVPMFGGGSTPAELTKSLGYATDAVNGKDGPGAYIEMLNPTKEAFEDWNDAKLQALLDTQGKRVISNRGLGLSADEVRTHSGESRQDANLIKLRIMQGVKPAVPVVGSIYTAYLKYMDNGSDANRSALIKQGLIPVVSNVTMQMQSDAIEPDNPVSSPGEGNGGNPADPGEPPTTPTNPTQPCSDSSNPTGCDLPTDPDPGGGGGACEVPVKADMSADALFDFDSATLSPAGLSKLKDFLEPYKDKTFDKVVINGYTDPLGSEAYNADLSLRRANAVALYLNQLGLKVMDAPIVEGKGATSPQVNPESCKGKNGNDLKACYAPDRRVTIELTPHS